MVTTLLLELIFNVFDTWFPDILVSLTGINDRLCNVLDGDSFNTFIDFIECVFYVLPADTLLAVITIISTLLGVRITIAFIKLIFSALPFF